MISSFLQKHSVCILEGGVDISAHPFNPGEMGMFAPRIARHNPRNPTTQQHQSIARSLFFRSLVAARCRALLSCPFDPFNGPQLFYISRPADCC